MTHRGMVHLFLLLVVVAPLPFGGNIPIAWTTYAVASGALVLSFSVVSLAQKRPSSVPSRALLFPATLFALVCLWVFIQSSGLTPAGWHNALWTAAADSLGQPLRGAISVNPYETRAMLMRLMTYGAVFWLALQFGRQKADADTILHGVAIGILLYAVYGLVLWSTGSKTILWYPKWTTEDSLTATFVNRNNFATFAGLGVIVFLGLFIRTANRALRQSDDERLKYRLERLLDALFGRLGFYFVALLLVSGALILSNSRAGFLATLFAAAVYLIITALRRSMGVLGVSLMGVVAITVTISLFNAGGNRLSQRLDQLELADSGRIVTYKRTIEAVKDAPILGTGYGTFADIFPMYRDESVSSWGRWRQAHNTYLENILELGIPAAAALFLAIGWAIWRCFMGALTRHRDSHLPLIGLAISVLVAAHALVDFSLQIPGMAITYAALLGVAVAQSWSSRVS